MSAKTARLLHRSGRNQFGDSGDGPLIPYQPSAESVARDNRLIEEHISLNEQFVQTHKKSWFKLFANLQKRAVWEKLHPHGKPALGTFYSMVRESDSFEEFLCWWLVCHKRQALALLGYERDQIQAQLQIFSECGRYHVRYGSSLRTFGTAA